MPAVAGSRKDGSAADTGGELRRFADRDMEGVVAKQASARDTPEATTWVKIKNRQHSQATGTPGFFQPLQSTIKLTSSLPADQSSS